MCVVNTRGPQDVIGNFRIGFLFCNTGWRWITAQWTVQGQWCLDGGSAGRCLMMAMIGETILES